MLHSVWVLCLRSRVDGYQFLLEYVLNTAEQAPQSPKPTMKSYLISLSALTREDLEQTAAGSFEGLGAKV